MPSTSHGMWAGAVISSLLMTAAFADRAALSRQAVAGEYAIGQDANQTFLSLLANGKFAMRTGRDLGDQVGNEVRGTWSIKAAQVVLRSAQPNHPFQWQLQTVPHASALDLVPEELAEFYATAPSNPGTRYRRYAGPASADLQLPARKILPAQDEFLKTGGSLVLQASTTSRPRSKTVTTAPAPIVPSPPVMREPAVFVYQPAADEEMNVRALRGPGLVRLSTDARGRVIDATVIESTGQKRFDANAVDVLRRWRVQPGPPREIEVPLTTIMNGKRAPVRIPLSTGSMSSG